MDLVVKASRSTFGIEFLFSVGILRFSGDSFPENSNEFFEPLIRWVENFVSIRHPRVRVEFTINYFNTSSSKYIFLILSLLKRYHGEGNVLEFVWYETSTDNEMVETWKEIMEELQLDFTIQQV